MKRISDNLNDNCKMNIDALVCQFNECKNIFLNPVALPCGNSLCQQHIDQFNDKFNCLFCNKEHQIPNDGFGINKSINMLLESYFEMNPLRKKIQDSFVHLDTLIKVYERINPDTFVSNYFEDLKNRINLHQQELIKEINKKSNELK